MPENTPTQNETRPARRRAYPFIYVYLCVAAVFCAFIFAAYIWSGSSHPTPTPPLITSQPSSQIVAAGQSATFAAAVTGTAPLAYQWLRNGADIPGATSASYTTPAATASDSGSTFQVVITNSVGDVASHPATLTVTRPSARAR